MKNFLFFVSSIFSSHYIPKHNISWEEDEIFFPIIFLYSLPTEFFHFSFAATTCYTYHISSYVWRRVFSSSCLFMWIKRIFIFFFPSCLLAFLFRALSIVRSLTDIIYMCVHALRFQTTALLTWRKLIFFIAYLLPSLTDNFLLFCNLNNKKEGDESKMQ